METLSFIIEIVQTLGFPIAVCIACFWYINKKDEQHKAELEKITEMHRLEMETESEQHKKALDNMTDAINNNTVILTKLLVKLDKE